MYDYFGFKSIMFDYFVEKIDCMVDFSRLGFSFFSFCCYFLLKTFKLYLFHVPMPSFGILLANKIPELVQ